MKRKTRIRRFLSVMLAVAMLGSSSAVTVLAETLQEAAVQEDPTVQDNAAPVSEEGSAEKDTAEQQPAQTGDSTSAGETADSDEGNDAGESEDVQVSDSDTEDVSFTTGVFVVGNEGERELLKGIKVRIYDAQTYDEDAEENVTVAEAEAEEDGFVRLEGLPRGDYRVEYVSTDPEFDASVYSAVKPDESAGYQIVMSEDERQAEEDAGEIPKDRDYFAWAGNVTLQESRQLELELKETEPEDESSAADDTGNGQPVSGTEADSGETEEAAGGENPADDEEPEKEENPAADDAGDLSDPAVPETIDDLKNLAETETGAVMEVTPVLPNMLNLMSASGSGWTFDAYYVNESDRYYVEEDHDFNLKYQMEFHTSQNLPAGTVEIRIPAALLTYRDGTRITPDDIAVPRGTLESYVYSSSTPFNYYEDPLTGELVFFNYRDIISGSNAAWQVLYKNLEVMEITDETEWSLTPKVEVTILPAEGQEGKPVTETEETEPLEGYVDTYANLASVSKTAYHQSGKSYTPGLYTEQQVSSYISGSLPEKYAGDNFKDYRFVVWEVRIKGNGTQPFNLSVEDTSTIDGENIEGEIVGYRNNLNTVYDLPLTTGKDISDNVRVVEFSKKESWGSRFYVVTAYPAEQVDNGTVLENDIRVTLDPYDQKDEDQQKEDSAVWSYADYVWNYPPGDMTNITKTFDETYEGWLEVYQSAAENGQDFGSFPFNTRGYFRGYILTHAIDNDEDIPIGTYKEGTSYKLTTVDDFMYAYPSGTDDEIMLGKDDYYFNSVTVTQTDAGYDVWEDEKTEPETVEGIDQSLYVYAMYRDSTDWELAGTAEWNESGEMQYTFTADQIARGPWRVKAEHEAVSYDTTCQIDVTVRLRHDSPVMKDILEKYDSGELTDMRLEDISGIAGSSYTRDENGKKQFDAYWHFQTLEGNYGEEGLLEATKELYKREDNGKGLILQRDNAFKTLTGLTTHAASFKTARSANDPDNSRVLVDYCLTAYDGYEIYGQEGIDYLKQAGVTSPGRNNVVFYDLLPYGMRFDPSGEVTAGRITNIDTDDYKSQPGSWDKSQVTVTVDSENDIIENYRGTGRTMVVFHIEYSGADAAVYSDNMWLEGWGISFQAYYDWKDLDVVQDGMNICAFMPEDKEDHPLYGEPLLGEDDEVACDDGIIVPSDPSGDYDPFAGGDINEDKITDIRNVLYAKSSAIEDMALANESKITKLVRADSDRFGVYGTSAVVEIGGGYTYDITVSNADNEKLKDIVVFDRLENAVNDRESDSNDPMQPFPNGSWYGTFRSVVTEGLEELGIKPQIWYNADREAQLPVEAQDPSDVLTAENGWYKAEEFEQAGHALSDVEAVAVDLSEMKDGSEFCLESMESVTFQIKMKAPDEMPAEGIIYAYNNPSFYSFHTGTDTPQTVEGNSVKVSMGEAETLEVIKEFSGEVPEEMADTEFRFCLYQEQDGGQIPFANQEYELYKRQDGKWVQQTGRLYATDGSGYLTLRADEKAVFKDLPDAGRIHVEETESPFWDTETETAWTGEGEPGAVRTVTVKNAYRPVLYAQKDLEAVPDGVNVSQDEFTFQIKVKGSDGNWQPLSNTEFWYVDSVRTDGGIPQKVESLGDNGTGETDEEGRFTISEGEIIALFPGELGVEYELSEADGAGEDTDWICREDTVSGTVPVLGASASITNIYKWKDLYLTKSLTHQDPEDCEQEFTFKITTEDESGEPVNVTGNRWVMLDAAGYESTVEGESGTLDANGEFTCACAGRIVKIKGLEGGKTYTVTETESGELYRPANGSVEAELPIYSSSQNVEITNDYLLRPLSVTKIVTYDADDEGALEAIESKEFTMTVRVNSELLVNYPYTLTENGSVIEGSYQTDEKGEFKLKHGQTATFEDVAKEGTPFVVTETQHSDYPQIFPAAGEPHQGEIEAEGSSVTFINGTSGGLMLSKEYEGADEIGNEYVELMKDPESTIGKKLRKDAAVKLTLEVTDKNGNTENWTLHGGKRVTVVDQLTGDVDDVWWNYNSYIKIEPWKTILIPASELTEYVSYRLTESADDQHRVFEWTAQDGGKDGQWLEVSQKDPADDQGVSGTIEERPVAEIINLISSVPEGSEIEKRMAPGSEEVPEGAELIWRLEKYDGTAWNPAEGVEYLVFDDAGAVSDRTIMTGADGIITLTKTASGYPRVRFPDEKVWINRYDGAEEGDLRLVEATDQSDESWGVLAGYGTADDQYGFSLDLPSEDAAAFVNSNRRTPVEIEKKMENPSDAAFTMILEQVISASADPVIDVLQIVETEPGAGIEYTVYDTETGAQTGQGVTGRNGEIYLRAGQYARLELPDHTLWTVREEQKADHVLKELTGTPQKKVTKLSDNLMLIRSEAEVIPGVLDVQPDKTRVNAGETLTTDDFTVNVVYSDGTKVRLDSDEYTITPETVPDQAGPMDVTVTWTEGGLEAKVTLNVVGEITLSNAMVNAGVIDAQTGDKVVLDSGDVTIPEYIIWDGAEYRVIGIGNYAFRDAKLTEIHFPDSITSIGSHAFQNQTNLTGELELPDHLQSIEQYAFQNCRGFTGSLTIPDSVKSIGDYAFQNCSGFTGSLTIPDSVTSIGASAFSRCSGFSGNLTIPDSVTSIGNSAFRECSGFNGSLTISKNITTIENVTFYECTGLTGALTIPDGVTSIGMNAFARCGKLTGELTIPNSVTSIERSAFEGCRSFTGNLVIPNGITSISESTFESCSGFNGTLIIPDGVTSIGNSAFRECSGFNGILMIPDSVTSIGSYAFFSCRGFTGGLTIPDSVTSIGDHAFSSCSGFDGSLTISKNITTISSSTFYECTGLTGGLTIPSSVTSIGNNAFAYCGQLDELTIPNSVTRIDSGAFFGCNGFTGSLTIPSSVTSIGNTAFYNCSGFTGSLTIPSSVTSIGTNAFGNCLFESITVNNTEDAVTGAPWGYTGTVRWTGNAGALNLTTADARKEEEFR